MRLLFQQQKIAVLQEVGSGEPAHTSAHDDNFMALGNGRNCKVVTIAHLMANGIAFAINLRSVAGGLRQQRQVHGAASCDRTCDHDLDKFSAIGAHRLSILFSFFLGRLDYLRSSSFSALNASA